MVGVLIGFAIIGVVVGVGYLVGRLGLLGPEAGRILARLAFFVLSPALLFTVLAESDVHNLFSALLPVAALSAAVAAAIALTVMLLLRRGLPEATITALGASYVNAGNIGLPVSAYVFGDPATSAPVILLQLVVLAPIALTVLDLATSGRVSVRRVLLQPVRNPLIIGAALGLVVALLGIRLPDPVVAPLELIAGAAVPVILLNFGMSLHGARPLARGTDRVAVLLASALTLGVMPLTAWIAGEWVFGLDGTTLFAAVVLAGLPAAQNVYTYAQRYARGVVIARDTVLITTLASVPLLVLVAALLSPPG